MNIASLFSMILSSQKNDSFKFSFRSQEHPAKGMTCQQYFHELEVICKKDHQELVSTNESYVAVAMTMKDLSFSSIEIHTTIIQYAIAVLSKKMPSTYGSTIQRGVQYSVKNPNKTNSKYTAASVESNSIFGARIACFCNHNQGYDNGRQSDQPQTFSFERTGFVHKESSKNI